jgi:hypothetical protein
MSPRPRPINAPPRTKRVVALPVETWRKINIIKAARDRETVFKVIEEAINEVYAKLKLPE